MFQLRMRKWVWVSVCMLVHVRGAEEQELSLLKLLALGVVKILLEVAEMLETAEGAENGAEKSNSNAVLKLQPEMDNSENGEPEDTRVKIYILVLA